MIRGIVFDCFGVLYGGCVDIFVTAVSEGQARVVFRNLKTVTQREVDKLMNVA